MEPKFFLKISDHQQSWGEQEGPWKEPALLVVADFYLLTNESFTFSDNLRKLNGF